MMNIADSFYKLNDILINDDKVILLTNSPLSTPRNICFTINGRQISLTAKLVNHSKRFLGVWISLYNLNHFILKQIEQEIQQDVTIMHHKIVTDKQLQYIFNAVIILRLEYCSQLTFILKDKYH